MDLESIPHPTCDLECLNDLGNKPCLKNDIEPGVVSCDKTEGDHVLLNKGDHVLLNKGDHVLLNDGDHVLLNDGDHVLLNKGDHFFSNKGDHPSTALRDHGGIAPTGMTSLSDVVRCFKTLTTKRYIDGVHHQNWPPFPGKLWQRNYYEHIIQNDISFAHIREYIAKNPMRWTDDP
jgi:hypothetical protein